MVLTPVLAPALVVAQTNAMPATEELPAIDGAQNNNAVAAPALASTSIAAPTPQPTSAPTLQDVAVQAAAPAINTPTPTMDDVINNVVNVQDTAALGAAPAAEIAPLEEEPPAELTDDPMQPQKYAVLGALDKVTGRTATLNVLVDKTVAVGPLFLQVKACQKASAFANQPENAAFVQVWQSDESSQKNKATSWVFSGWMFASSPALSAMDHPVYDVWVIDCKNDTKQAKPVADETKPKVGTTS